MCFDNDISGSAFDQWCQRCILRLHYSDHVTSAEVRNRTGCVPATEIICSRRRMMFGHIARSELSIYHCCVLRSSTSVVCQLPGKRPCGRPRHLDPDHHWSALCGAEHRTDLTGEYLLGQLRSSRSMLLMMMKPWYPVCVMFSSDSKLSQTGDLWPLGVHFNTGQQKTQWLWRYR